MPARSKVSNQLFNRDVDQVGGMVLDRGGGTDSRDCGVPSFMTPGANLKKVTDCSVVAIERSRAHIERSVRRGAEQS